MTLRRSAKISLAAAALAWLPWGAAGFLFVFFAAFALVNFGALAVSLLRD